MEKNAPLVSVIVPMYNRRKYIEECLDSIFAQTLQDFEILCIDDGSTDGCAEFCAGKYGGDTRFRLVHQENTGAGAARNHGLDLARGVYVTFVDSDDFLGRDAFEHMMRLAQIADADIVQTMGCYLVRDGERRLMINREDPEHAEKPYLLPDTMEARLARYRLQASTAVWTRFFRRAFIEQYHIRFPQTKYHEDCLFVLSCLFRARTYVCTPYLYYVYRVSYDSLLRAPKSLQEVWDVIRTMPVILREVDERLQGLSYFPEHPETLRMVKEYMLDEILKMLRRWGFYPTPEESVDVMKDAVFGAFASLDLTPEETACLFAYLFDRFNTCQGRIERAERGE